MVHIHWRLRRLMRHLLSMLDFEWWFWEYESCRRCGACYRFFYSAKDGVWRRVVGSEDGCYCLECFAKMAEEKGLKLTMADFEWINILSI